VSILAVDILNMTNNGSTRRCGLLATITISTCYHSTWTCLDLYSVFSKSSVNRNLLYVIDRSSACFHKAVASSKTNSFPAIQPPIPVHTKPWWQFQIIWNDLSLVDQHARQRTMQLWVVDMADGKAHEIARTLVTIRHYTIGKLY